MRRCLYSGPVERHLKERLIGAAVLVAAAVILIPEMLSGRRDSHAPAATVMPAGDAPLKTYTIDLNRAPSQSSPSAMEEPATAAPPPEAAPVQDDAPVPATQEIPESSAVDSVQSSDPQSPPEDARPAVAAVTSPLPSTSAPVQQAPIAVQPQPEVGKAAGGWAVQLGSFSSQAKAQGMVGELRAGGYEAFVMPVKSGANTLYRVRIGPVASRDAAQGVQNKVKSKVPAATVVKHP